MQTLVSDDIRARAAKVRLMIFDVDGILTDGSLHYGPDGEVIKSFNVLDGHGIKMLQHAGIRTAIISARSSPIVARRAADLGISHVQQGVGNKKAAFDALLGDTGLVAEQCGFIGDDIIDLPILTKVVFAASVPNAHPEVASHVHYVSRLPGGKGAAREVCDLLLRSQGKYDALIAEHMAG